MIIGNMTIKTRYIVLCAVLFTALFLFIIYVMNFGKIFVFLDTDGGNTVIDKEDALITKDSTWFDDYYAVTRIDDRTFIILEPRYWQRNHNYLILGDNRAILFDSGPGLRNIEPVVRSLTSLPVISVYSHFHYDHVGSVGQFEFTILSENQLEDQHVKDHALVPNDDSYVGSYEGLEAKKIVFDEVINAYSSIDLGNRELQVIPMPGHAENSIGLYDKQNKMLFSGDFLMPGTLFTSTVISPDANLDQAKKSLKDLMARIDKSTVIYGGHVAENKLPILHYQDVVDFYNAIKDVSPRFYPLYPQHLDINKNIDLLY